MNEIVVELSGAEAPPVERRSVGDFLRSARWVFVLAAMTLAFGFAVVKRGAPDAVDPGIFLVIIGATALAYWLAAGTEERAPALDPVLMWLVALAPGYVLIQLIPLPAFLVGALSPARAHLIDLVDAFADTRMAPLTVNVAATLSQVIVVLGCAVTFLLVRDLAWRTRERFPWAVLAPIVVVGIGEAIVGLAQAAMHVEVRGTLANRASLAGVLEAVLPIALAGGIALTFRPSTRRPVVFVRPWVAVVTTFSVMLGLGVLVAGGSRMGLVATICGLLAMLASAVTARMARQTRIATTIGLLAACLFVVSAVPIDTVAGRFFATSDLAAVGRVLPVWKDALRLIGEYPLTGAGLGAFESAFPKYQTTALDSTVSFAGNDYLQLFGELGLLGAPVFIALLVTAHRRSSHTAMTAKDWATQWLHLGCTGAIAAVGVHSLADFNMHLPANAFMLAWVAGFAVSGPNANTAVELPRRWVVTPAFALLVLALVGALRDNPAVSSSLCRIGVCSQTLIAADRSRSVEAERVGHSHALLDAVSGTPTDAAAWGDLGDAMWASGRGDEARLAFANAVALAPNKPAIRERVANFYFDAGDAQRALVESAIAIADSDRAPSRIFDAYMRRGVPVEAVLERGLPSGPRGARGYLRALLAADRPADAATAWSWIESHQYADDALARDFVHYLFARGDHEQAARTWAGHVGDRATGYLQSSFVFDGGFESTPAGTEFDWQLNNLDDRVIVELDPQVARTGRQSLRVRFSRTDNVDYHHTRQLLFVEPGTYRFSAMVRAMGVTTDRGLQFHLFDAAEPRNVDVWTAAATGTTSWTLVEQTITVPDDVHLLTVEIAREKSEHFDSHIGGTLWIDDVALRRVE